MKKENQLVKIYLKFVILFLIIITLILGCEKNIYLPQEEIQQKKKLEQISFDEFENNIKSNKIFDKLQIYFENNNHSLLNKNVDFGNAKILTDEIIKIELENSTSYTFKIDVSIKGNHFFNLVLLVNDFGEIYESKILKYVPSNSIRSINSKQNNFIGCVSIINNDFFNVNDILQSRSSGECVVDVHSEWECSFGFNHAPGTCNGSWFDYILVIEYGSCENNTEQYDVDPPSNGGGGNSGGGLISDNSNQIPTSPIIPVGSDGNVSTANILINNLGLIDHQQIIWVLNPTNRFAVDKIYNYLISENWSNQSIDFINSAIEIISEPILLPNQDVVGYTSKIQKMITHLKQFGNPEDEFYANYIESIISDFSSMTVGDVYDIYKLTKKQTDHLIFKYLEAVVVPFAEAAYPFVIYALTEATLGAALPLLNRIPISMVVQGVRLEKMIIKLSKMGNQGSTQFIREIPNSSAHKAMKLFEKITQNKIGPMETIVTPNGNILRANMGGGNYITYREFATQSPNTLATIELNFSNLFDDIIKLKFNH